MLEPRNFGAETANQVHVLGDVMVHVQGVAGGVRLDVLGPVGVLERVERFFERRGGAANIFRVRRQKRAHEEEGVRGGRGGCTPVMRGP